MALNPPPAALHADSDWYWPFLPVVVRAVPPTAVTPGADAGVQALSINALLSHVGCPAPVSPDDPKNLMPWSPAVPKIACCWWTRLGSAQIAASPELCEMTSPRLLSAAYRVALRMSASWSLLASTRSMTAPGATACAHSTSSEISADQVRWLAFVLSK